MPFTVAAQATGPISIWETASHTPWPKREIFHCLARATILFTPTLSRRSRPPEIWTSWMTLTGKRILLIIGGGIAAYKCLDLIRRLRERGASVRCVMTGAARQFITPLVVG